MSVIERDKINEVLTRGEIPIW